jgi:hypothetical protein
LIAIINEGVRIGIFSSLADESEEFDELIEIDDNISRCWINSSCCTINDGVRIRRHDSLSNEHLRFNGATDNCSTNDEVTGKI